MLARSLLSSKTEEVKIFYSYSRKDSAFRSLVDNLLGEFKWDVEVRAWYDGQIHPGEEWAPAINRHLDAADIILLFITQQFIDSAYCMRVELPRALERHGNGDSCVIPVIIEHTTPDWRTLPFAHIQALPQNGQPLSQWTEPDDAIRNIVQAIVDIVATKNVDPNGRCHWQVYLEADRARFDSKDELRLIQDLRQVSEDPTLRPRAIGQGSVVALLESTNGGLRRVQNWFASGECRRLGGFPVTRIVERFGAGLHASVQSGTRHGGSPDAEPDPDLLLFPSEPFQPPNITGIIARKGAGRELDFICDTGDDNLQGDALRNETRVLIEYFYTALSAPADDLYVNLAPDESNRMLGASLEGTALGRAMLEADYRLKRLSASLLHPDSESGHEFWTTVFSQAQATLGNVGNYHTFQRVWISPDDVGVYVGAFEIRDGEVLYPQLAEGIETQVWLHTCHLNIKCVPEFVIGHSEGDPGLARKTTDICAPIFDDLIVPLIEREVNQGKSFAVLRQVYHAMALATWWKKRYRDDPRWSPVIESGKPDHLQPQYLGMSAYDFGAAQAAMKTPKKEQKTFTANMGAKTQDPAPPESGDECAQLAQLVSRAIELRTRGDLLTSRSLLERAALVGVAEYGPESPMTLLAQSELGRTLREMAELHEARRLHEVVLDVRSRVLGRDHNDTLKSMDCLAETLLEIGEATCARKLQSDAAEIRARKSEAYRIPENREYFEKYLRVFREGIFYLVRDEFDPQQGARETRTYFAGAIDFRSIAAALRERLARERGG
jgi:TIR domain-containing protein/tetratricopeptide repeat protein